ncbi:sugar kinase [Inhella proteolytica]|uniref:Sugar kinase n=1 Tax=Inhella proteolytica TaxID=2795029 RepID=A0A931J2Y3_9BURK|nr:sugar kinase [Inhella proteolytica]MBH9577195.1 sugar kinase [Inhella proteolytica]
MASGTERRLVLVTRRTRLEALVQQHHTLGQARFYVEHLGADFEDYLREHQAYSHSLAICSAALQRWGRSQTLERSLLPNFVFDADDIVLTLGQDGLVANVLKYLNGQPLVGLNPEPTRWDGVLLPFEPADLARLLPEVAADRRPLQSVTLAEAVLSDGQRLRAVNELFIGPRTHSSALYEIEWDGRREAQSSSGVIVATGLGSTGWLRSMLTGSAGLAAVPRTHAPEPWDAERLTFAVREPFPSRSSAVGLVHGHVSTQQPLRLRSRMPEQGVIFSDGMEADFLRFTAGVEATIGLAAQRGCLVR